jgi:hypothetical protein
MISTKTIRKNIGKIDGSYINTPAGKYYGGRYTDIPMYACSEKCIPAVESYFDVNRSEILKGQIISEIRFKT